MSPRGLRVLLVAENASRQMGGEAILPYHYFRILRARGVDVTLIVHERSRAELESLFPAEREHMRFIADHPLQKLFFGLGRLLPRRISEATFGLANQMLTQLTQRRMVRALATPGTIVHQPIPVSPRFPSLLWDVGAPVVIGPLNGGMDYPPAFRSSESLFSRAFIAAGRALSEAANAMLPGKRDAAVVLVANERTRQALPSVRGRVILLPENAVDPAQWSANTSPTVNEKPATNFVFIGRLVDWKALDIVLEAMRSVPAASLDVIGDGTMRAAWQSRAAQFGLADRVRFHGWRSQDDCAALLAGSCALVLPSLYECGGAVVLEAMASAKPVIATAWGGPVDYLDATCGVLVEPTSRTALIDGFSAAMRQFIDNPEAARELGLAGQIRVREHFDWEKKVDAMLAIYGSLVPTETATA